MSSVAIIDIGSNSIKTLVVRRAPDGRLESVLSKTIDARISAGISRAEPRLSESGMARGLAAIQELLADAGPFAPQKILLVATSAVRDALNGGDFRQRVASATGHQIRILNGDEEASLIGRGLTCDRALEHLQNFYVFDLGGGSLEALAFRDRHIARAQSFQLGCVRLTERFIADSTAPVPIASQQNIHEYTRTMFTGSSFSFDLPADAEAVGTGGTLTTARAIFAARQGVPLQASSAFLPVSDLRALLEETAAMPLESRRKIAGLPTARADVFPAALATFAAVAELGGFAGFHHSLYNLRWGLAAELIG